MKKKNNPFLPVNLSILEDGLQIKKGTLLFADISGFTRMSEHLASFGLEGTETLTEILNEYFDMMLGVVKKCGGDVLKFAGDAVLVEFEEQKDARECAREMMEALKNFSGMATPAGKLNLTMKVITSSGEYVKALLGDTRRAEIFLSGETVKKLAEEEDGAKPGEIIHTYSKKRVKVSAEGFYTHKLSPETLLNPGVDTAPNEFRPVASIFVVVSGYKPESPDIYLLQSFFTDTLDIVLKYGGSLHLLDSINPEGFKLMLLFGAPVSTGNDCERAVLTAISIAEIAGMYPGIRIKIGVNYGYVYAGVIGNDWRKEYTVIGDAVNTSARLSHSSDGRPICSSEIFRITKNRFLFDELEPVRVKGKKIPLKRYIPTGRAKFSPVHYRFVGREKEVKKILDWITSGEKLILIEGEAGIGKSRLLHEIDGIMRGKGFSVLRGNADIMKSTYTLFSSMIMDYLNINEELSPEEKRKALERYVKTIHKKNINEELNKRVQLLSHMLFASHIEDMSILMLPPEIKKENLFDGIRYFILSTGEQCITILDDLNAAREEEIEALEYLSRVLKNTIFILSSRPEHPEFPFRKDSVKKITLKGLSYRASKSLIEEILKEGSLSSELEKNVLERSEGNPFYIEQFILYLKEKGLIKKTDDKWYPVEKSIENIFPENIFSMIMARIDRLGNMAKETLRVGSSIGINFSSLIVEKILRRPVQGILEKTASERIVYPGNIEELEYIFSHAIIRDVIYQSILRKKRKQIHYEIGNVIEKIYQDRIKEFYGSLAFHFSVSEKWNKAIHYSLLAGKQALERFAGNEAICLFQNAVDIMVKNNILQYDSLREAYKGLCEVFHLQGRAKESLDVYDRMYNLPDTETKVEALMGKIEALEKLGRLEECVSLFSELDKLLGKVKTNKNLLSSRVCLTKAWVYRTMGNSEKAMEMVNNAKKDIKRVRKSDNRLKTELEINNLLGVLNWTTGDYKGAIRFFKRNLELLQKSGNLAQLAKTQCNLGSVYRATGEYIKAKNYFRNCLETSSRIGYKNGITASLNNLALILVVEGDYSGAAENYSKALELAEETGNLIYIHQVLGNLGNVFFSLGKYERALEFYNRAIRISQQVGDIRGEAIESITIGDVYRVKGIYNEARRCYNRAIELYKIFKDKKWKGIALTGLGNIELSLKNLENAEKYYTDALQIFKEINAQREISTALASLGTIYRKQKNIKKALEFLRKAEEKMEVLKDTEALIQVKGELGILYALKGDKRAEEYLESCRDAAKEIGSPIHKGIASLYCGRILFTLGRIEDGEKEFIQGIKTLKKWRPERFIKELYMELAEFVKDKYPEKFREYMRLSRDE